MENTKFEVHPAATLFPMMTSDEYEGLKHDINENGQREDIVIWKGQIIDGRNRLRVCEELRRTPSIAELDEDEDPWKYVISHNLHRRHLTTSQRAQIAEKMATLKHGDNQHGKEDVQNCTSSLDEAAKALNVSRRTVATARTVRRQGDESVNDAVAAGKLPVTAAEKLVKAVPDKTEQAKIVAKGPEEVRRVIKETPPPKPAAPKASNKPELSGEEFQQANLKKFRDAFDKYCEPFYEQADATSRVSMAFYVRRTRNNDR